MVGLHSFHEAESAQGPPSATERRECKRWMPLLLRDADSGQTDHIMAAEPTHGPHHPCTSSSWLGTSGLFLAIGNLPLTGGSSLYLYYSYYAFSYLISPSLTPLGFSYLVSPSETRGEGYFILCPNPHKECARTFRL